MSTFIIDQFAAARFPAEALHKIHADPGFHEDRYLFFLLGGDNNVFTVHHGRERRARSWRLVAFGQAWTVMAELVRIAADCEGGCIRFNRERGTLPEALIRRARKALAAAAAPEQITGAGLSCIVPMSIRPEYRSAPPDYVRNNIEQLVQLAGPRVDHSWSLQPLNHMADAAALFAFHFLAGEALHQQARVSWPRYESLPLLPADRAT